MAQLAHTIYVLACLSKRKTSGGAMKRPYAMNLKLLAGSKAPPRQSLISKHPYSLSLSFSVTLTFEQANNIQVHAHPCSSCYKASLFHHTPQPLSSTPCLNFRISLASASKHLRTSRFSTCRDLYSPMGIASSSSRRRLQLSASISLYLTRSCAQSWFQRLTWNWVC